MMIMVNLFDFCLFCLVSLFSFTCVSFLCQIYKSSFFDHWSFRVNSQLCMFILYSFMVVINSGSLLGTKVYLSCLFLMFHCFHLPFSKLLLCETCPVIVLKLCHLQSGVF